jgi:hypothetical protein
MTRITQYTMSERLLKIIISRGNSKTVCITCGRPIVDGDNVVSAKKVNGVRLRHLECARKVGMI